MKRSLVWMVAGLVLAGMAPVVHAADGDKVLYDFEKGKDGFWTYANNATLTLDQDATTGAGGSTGSLKASYQWKPGPMSYMGIGIQPKWRMGSDSWTNYAKGHMTISLKSDVSTKIHIELRMSDKKAYSFVATDVPSTWKDYTIGFDKFVDKDGAAVDLSAADVNQLVIGPSKVNEDAHTLWIDNVTISKTPAAP